MLKIAKLAFPSMIALLLSYLTELTNSFVVGHLNDPELLAGISLGNIIISMFCISIYLGMNGALETLISQAYGYGNLSVCTIYLNRGRTIMMLTFIPISILLTKADSILIALG